jgi:hypothetical protein
MKMLCPAGLDIAMHNEPGYPLNGWYISPQFSLHSETNTFVKPDYEPLVRPEAEPVMKLDVEVMPKNGTEKVKKSDTDAARKKVSTRPKSDSDADRYVPRRLVRDGFKL